MPIDNLRSTARISAARKLASEMADDMATEHLSDEPEAVDSPAEEAQEPAEQLSPEDEAKLKQFVDMLK